MRFHRVYDTINVDVIIPLSSEMYIIGGSCASKAMYTFSHELDTKSRSISHSNATDIGIFAVDSKSI